MRRRDVLRVTAGALPALIAGCSQNGDEATSTATATDTPTPTDTQTTDQATATPTATEQTTATQTSTPQPTPTVAADYEISVDPADNPLRFVPDQLELSAGETVRWVWKGGGHNVVPNDIPDASDWDGTPGGATTTYGEGYVYAHTFEVAGSYTYYCAPHRGQGMRASLTVR